MPLLQNPGCIRFFSNLQAFPKHVARERFSPSCFSVGRLLVLFFVVILLFLPLFFVIVLLFVVLTAGIATMRAAFGVGTFVAVVVIVADVTIGSEFVAGCGLVGGLYGFDIIIGQSAVDESGGEFEPVEKSDGLSQIETAVEDGVVDACDGELDGRRILWSGE